MNVLLRSLIERLIRTGNLTVIDHKGRSTSFGDQNGTRVTIAIHSAHAQRAITFDPVLALPESYMNGEIDLLEGDLLDLLEVIYKNSPTLDVGAFWTRMADGFRHGLRRLQQFNTTERARRNVRRHYDLSRELYQLFLDTDLQYSCAYFARPDMTLEEAQLAKKRHLAAKLALRPGQTVLDIGCGFGGLGLYLARNLDVDVLGITLSEEQLAIATERAQQEGLDNRAHFELRDYRKLGERFDRIVSVGMFEHVGVNHYRAFFDKCATILKPDGVMVLHSIGRSGPPSATTPFIRKHIFPGGYIPALSEVLPAIERSGLQVTDVEILRLHYADTLRHWRQRFLTNRDRIREIYDERFCRMWEFYLAGSEAAFRWQDLMVFQIQLARRNDTLPVTRDYIGVAEDRLADADERRPPAPTATSKRRRTTS